MARPIKHNAEYFRHENGMRNDRKLRAVRAKFGLQGYAIYNMILESLAEADMIRIEIDELTLEMMAGDFGIDSALLQEMIDYFDKIDLMSVDDGTLQCRQLDRRLKCIFDKRNQSLEDIRGENLVSGTETEVTEEETGLPSRDSRAEQSRAENRRAEQSARGAENEKLLGEQAPSQKPTAQDKPPPLPFYCNSKFGVDATVIEQYIKAHGEKYVWQKVDILEYRLKYAHLNSGIPKPGGYLVKLIREDGIPPPGYSISTERTFGKFYKQINQGAAWQESKRVVGVS